MYVDSYSEAVVMNVHEAETLEVACGCDQCTGGGLERTGGRLPQKIEVGTAHASVPQYFEKYWV